MAEVVTGEIVKSERLPHRDEWELLRDQSSVLAQSEFVPEQFRNKPGDVTVALLMARDLGISGIRALNEIAVIDGQPSMSALLMRSLVRKARHQIQLRQSDNRKATAWGKRTDTGEETEISFTIEQAVQAGLCKLDDKGRVVARSKNNNPLNWEKWTEDMLVARATSRLCRRLFEDVLFGYAYTPEEMREPIESSESEPQPVLPDKPEAPLPGVHPEWIERLLLEHSEDEILSTLRAMTADSGRRISSLHDLHPMPIEWRVALAERLRDERDHDSGEVASEGSRPLPDADHCSAHETRVESCTDCQWSGSVQGKQEGSAPAGGSDHEPASGETSNPPSDAAADPVSAAEKAHRAAQERENQRIIERDAHKQQALEDA